MNKPLEKALTKKDLADFTEETLLPAVERIVDKKIDEKVPLIVNKIVDEKVPSLVYPIVNKVKLELMDHIDIKIADLRGDIVLLLRKDDRRFLHLIDILYKKKLLNEGDIKSLEDLQLFPKPSV